MNASWSPLALQECVVNIAIPPPELLPELGEQSPTDIVRRAVQVRTLPHACPTYTIAAGAMTSVFLRELTWSDNLKFVCS